jgi:hypothetical protein
LSEATQLVLCQGFRGEEIKGAAIPIAHKRIECGQVIAQGLAAGAGRGYYHIFPGKNGIQGFRLVAVKSWYAQGFQRCLQAGMKGFIEFLEDCALMRNPFDVDDLLAVISQAE